MAQIDSNLYSALATVAAITTALQGAVALSPLNESSSIGCMKKESSAGEHEWSKAKEEAKQRRNNSIVLNIPVLAVNITVLISWQGLGLLCARWELLMPWFAVAGSALFLLLCAAY